jgi:hypothetical protein
VQDLLYRLEITYFAGSLYMDEDLQISQDLEPGNQLTGRSENKEAISYFEVVRNPEQNGQRGKNQVTPGELFLAIAQKVYNNLSAQRERDELVKNLNMQQALDFAGAFSKYDAGGQKELHEMTPEERYKLYTSKKQ